MNICNLDKFNNLMKITNEETGDYVVIDNNNGSITFHGKNLLPPDDVIQADTIDTGVVMWNNYIPPKIGMTCKHCGAQVPPNLYGKCEYCGGYN